MLIAEYVWACALMYASMLHADFTVLCTCLEVKQRSVSVPSTTSSSIYNGTNMLKYYVYMCKINMYREK